MKIGILSDIHGNSIAVEQVLFIMKEKIKVDDIYFLGDAVGYMPEVNNVANRIRQEGISCLMGNHEAMLLNLLPVPVASERIYKLNDARADISNENRTFFSNLAPLREKSINNYNILMVHGSPDNPLNGYVYPDTDISGMSSENYSYIFMGHTHRPFLKQLGSTTWVNVGSCGLPRDAGDLASFVVFDAQTGDVQIYRVPLRIEEIIEAYGPYVHEDVISCFKRKYDITTICGKIIE